MTVFLLCLKIILIIILSIIGILLLLLGVILFCPFKYVVNFEKEDENIESCITVYWLFRLVRFRFEYDKVGGIKYYCKVLFFSIIDNNKPDKPSKKKTKIKNSTKSLDKHLQEDVDLTESKDDKDNSDKKDSSDKKYSNKNTAKSQKKETFGDKIEKLKSSYKTFKNYPNKKAILDYTIKFLTEFLYAFKPKIYRIKIIFGFEEAYQTGSLIGKIYMIKPFIFPKADIKGDFQEKRADGFIFIYDYISIWDLVFPIIKYILKKPIFKLIKFYFSKKRRMKHE